MRSTNTWAYGTVLRHAPNIPYALEDTLVMFIRWEKQIIPVLLILHDGAAPHPASSMAGHMDAMKIHPKDWEVVA